MFQMNQALRLLPWVVLLGGSAAPLAAQFEQTSPLYFSMAQGGASPLPQVLPVASPTNSNSYFSAVASTTSGGNWLAVPSGSLYTPGSLLVSINNTVAASLAAGSYGGHVVVTANGGGSETIQVTLTVAPASAPFFANLPGGLTFARAPSGGAGSQVIQVNNAGSGTLNWTLTANTFNAANFLTVSANSGTAPSFVTVGVAAQNLPGGGATAGTFVGQLVFASATGSVTIPVAVSVGGTSFVQSNPIGFSMPSGGAAPLPQVIPGASTSTTNFYFQAAVYTATGGNWLTVSPAITFFTPDSPLVGVDETVASTLPAGVYTGEVVITSNSTGTAPAMAIPVILTISPASVPFFDNVPGGMSFFLPVHGANPGSQTLQIRNAGSGTLNWTAIAATSDGGNWLSVSLLSGIAPSLVTVQILAQYLPGGAAAGIYSGNILFQSADSTVSVPITVSVGGTAFLPVDPLSAVMPLHGSAPVVQAANISSTASNFYFKTTAYSATGGNWLTLVDSGTFFTPSATEIGFNQAVVSSLPAGTYTGEVVVSSNSTGYTAAITIPISLTVASSGEAFFDDFPGGLQFSLPANGANPGNQVIQVRNAGSGTLNWTVTASTSDGGSWLTVSSNSAAAPSLVTVGVVSQNLPGGAATGIYNGTLLFQSPSGTATLPITVSVGGTGFAQVNPLSFNMPQSGAAPLPQSIAVSSTSSSGFYFDVSSSTSAGGNWLNVSQTGTLYTPEALTVSMNQSVASALPAGIYTGEVILTPHSTGTAAPLTVSVTLTVSPTSTSFFDNLPGGLQFGLQANGGNPANQVFQIRNAGTAALNWTVVPTTADGGNWLTVSANSGTAPSLVSVGVIAAKLPGGASAGSYRGSLLFENGVDTVTVPITVSVGVIAFAQANPLSFTMPLHGSVPLPQEAAITALTSTGFYFDLSVSSATGGNWLTVSPAAGTLFTPQSLTVGVDQAVASSLPAGTYTAEIIMTPHSSDYTAAALTLPVTLTVTAPGTAFFDNLPGALYFSTPASSGNPASQILSIRNEGSGPLTWTAVPSTSDGGNWLTVSSTTGTAPSSLAIGILAQNLPGQGGTAGTYTGQILLQTSNGSVTVPVTVAISTGAFVQSNGLVFTAPPTGSSQTLNIANIGGSGVNLNAASFAGNGGNWLSISPNGSTSSPRSFTLTVNASSLAAGTYTGEALFVPTNGAAGQTVQVTFNVNTTSRPYLTASGGTPQSANPGAPFANPLVATVTDENGNPISGVTVTFTAPASGATGTFAGGVNTALTNAQGQATSAVFTANGIPGSYTVMASVGSLRANYALTNTGPQLTSITVTPASPSIMVGATQQFTATGTYSDNSTQNLTASATWVSGTTSVATISAGGLATGLARGTSNITATYGGVASAPADVLTVTSGSSATYSGLDLATQGTWTARYGADGAVVANAVNNPPAYAAINLTGDGAYTWTASTSDVRALQTVSGSANHIASAYYSNSSFTVDLNLTDGKAHRVALYLLDWDSSARSESITIQDAVSNTVLNTQTFSRFQNGEYAVWNIQGHVLIQVTKTGGPNALVAGIFFDSTSASFVTYNGLDTATQGTWTGQYGADGAVIANAANTPPAYATINFTGENAYTWVTSTSDMRALQISSGSPTHIASAYYSNTSFTIDLNLTDGNAHRIALYLLDWDSTARSETISILDAATNTVLNAQTFFSFHNGQYAVWNIQGHVLIQVTQTGGPNAVVAGIFFDPGSTSFAAYSGLDTSTQGTWTGQYGIDGAVIANTANNPPAYAAVNMISDATYTWTASTSDVRALQTVGGSSTRIASAYYSNTSFYIDLNLTDGKTHRIALYLLDWDSTARSETVSILDAASNTVLSAQTFSSFQNGEYAVWNIKGHVLIQVTRTGGANALLAAIFFDPASTTFANYSGLDTSTQGTWTGQYGADGNLIANDATNPPAYAAVNLAGDGAYTWTASTSDVRALQTTGGSSTRIASGYYSNTSFTIDLNLTDGKAHRLAFYLLDWDSSARSETISILDAASNAILDMETFSNFHNGEYAIWNLRGHVLIQVAPTAGDNAVIAGMFFN